MRKLKIPTNLTALAYKSIKEYILEGRLDEDSRVDRGIPVRPIGHQQISHSGSVEPARGGRPDPDRSAPWRYHLRSFSNKEVDDLYDVREALEIHAVRTGNVLPPSLIKEIRAPA